MSKFETELDRFLQSVPDDDPAKAEAIITQIQRRTHRRAVAVTMLAALCFAVLAVAIGAGLDSSANPLHHYPAGRFSAVPVWLPIAVMAALLVMAISTAAMAVISAVAPWSRE
ncbi:MAG: hypothetical protein ABL882_05695 [Sphingopyxis sp.]